MTVEGTNTLNIWLPLITGSVGLASGIILEWFRDGRTYKREREGRDFARRDAQLERCNEFQRQTLLALQEEVGNHLQSGMKFYAYQTIEHEKKGSEWSEIVGPSETSTAFTTSSTKAQMLGVRVHDESVREYFSQFRKLTGRVILARSKEDATKAVEEANNSFRLLNERIGEIVRGFDRELATDSAEPMGSQPTKKRPSTST